MTPGVRRAHRAIVALLSVAMLAACGGGDERPASSTSLPADPAEANWRQMATQADRERLRNWRDAWTAGLARAGASELAKADPKGGLFDPDVAKPGAVPPPGDYRCRVFKLGASGTAMAEFTSYPATDCTIADEGEVSSFYKSSGSQRPVGLIFRDDANRAIFLGTLVIGDEARPMQYGRDANRDLAGYVERIGDRRWRLVLPSPAFESLIDVVELVPVGK